MKAEIEYVETYAMQWDPDDPENNSDQVQLFITQATQHFPVMLAMVITGKSIELLNVTERKSYSMIPGDWVAFSKRGFRIYTAQQWRKLAATRLKP